MKNINKKILFAIGMTVRTMLGYCDARESFLEHSRPLIYAERVNAVGVLYGNEILSKSEEEIVKIGEAYEIPLNNIRIVDWASIKDSIKDKKIEDLQSMDYSKFYEEVNRWVDTKGLDNEDANIFKIILNKLSTFSNGRMVLTMTMALDEADATRGIFFKKGENSSASLLTSGGMEIQLPFSQFLYTELLRVYRWLNYYVQTRLGMVITDDVIGDFSIPFARKFLGGDIDHVKSKWRSLNELWSKIGFCVIKHPTTNDTIVYIDRTSLASFCENGIFLHDIPQENVYPTFLVLQNLNVTTECKLMDEWTRFEERGGKDFEVFCRKSMINSLQEEKSIEECKKNFLDYSSPVTDNWYKQVAKKLHLEVGGKSTEEIKNSLGLGSAYVRRITFRSIVKRLMKLGGDYEKAGNKCNCWNKVSYVDFCKEIEHWVEQKKSDKYLPQDDADVRNFIDTLKELAKYPSGRHTLELTMALDLSFSDKRITFRKTIAGELAKMNIFNFEIWLSFSRFLYCNLREVYHEFNHYIHLVLKIMAFEGVMDNDIAYALSIPFVRKLLCLGEDEYKSYDEPELAQKIRNICDLHDESVKVSDLIKFEDVMINNWGSCEELFNELGIAFHRGSKASGVYIYICSLSDANLFPKSVILGHPPYVYFTTHPLRNYIQQGPVYRNLPKENFLTYASLQGIEKKWNSYGDYRANLYEMFKKLGIQVEKDPIKVFENFLKKIIEKKSPLAPSRRSSKDSTLVLPQKRYNLRSRASSSKDSTLVPPQKRSRLSSSSEQP